MGQKSLGRQSGDGARPATMSGTGVPTSAHYQHKSHTWFHPSELNRLKPRYPVAVAPAPPPPCPCDSNISIGRLQKRMQTAEACGPAKAGAGPFRLFHMRRRPAGRYRSVLVLKVI
ncbi:hypothetical protein E2C01_087793 [Portunus trituberculatus]|uniref:Uncharacterized protein n=1 Tax=Portunus trituberculatus TaxID=210409 RepID=A0A5B7JCT5_PORTR|nr:hypothetical protein [Portunus trituberculatus]